MSVEIFIYKPLVRHHVIWGEIELPLPVKPFHGVGAYLQGIWNTIELIYFFFSKL